MKIKTMAFLATVLSATLLLAAPQRLVPTPGSGRAMVHAPPLRLTGAITTNRHLHLGPPAGKTKFKGTTMKGKILAHKVRPDARRHEHWYWHRRWDFAAWAVLHRHLGTIEGTVRNAAGQGVSGVKLVLRKAKGGIFASLAMKHIVHSGLGGHFTMLGVRSGRYRIMAFVGKKGTAHAQILVRPGGIVGVGLGV